MRYIDLIESRNTPCVVVDVQPAYSHRGYFKTWDLMKFLESQHGPILMFVNAEQEGLTNDTVSDIEYFWEENGFNDWHRVTVNDKGYGYLRQWMDIGIDDAIIIKVIREMYSQKVNDSRELFDGEDGEEYDTYLKTLGFKPEYHRGFGISVEWLSLSQLKEHSPCYIMGGGRNECLREVELMMCFHTLSTKE